MVISGPMHPEKQHKFSLCIHKLQLMCGLQYVLQQVGLKGEAMNLVSPNEASSVDWIQESLATQSRSQLKWHKVRKITG